MILTELFQRRSLAEGANDPGVFKAVFMAGPPGAGKNKVIRDLGMESYGLRLQDIDQITAYLRSTRANAEAVIKRRQSILASQMLGLIINMTGRNRESLLRINNSLHAIGYDTFMIYVDSQEDIAWQRCIGRIQRQTASREKNEPVTKDYFDNAYASCNRNAPVYAIDFGDNFAYIKNDVVVQNDGSYDANESHAEFVKSVAQAGKKLQKFINSPLSPTANKILALAKRSVDR